MTASSVRSATFFPVLAAYVGALFAALIVGMAAFPGAAYGAVAGPFDVEGIGSDAWDGSTLTIDKEGVTIAGMADPLGATRGDVSVVGTVANVTLGTGVRIGTLAIGGTTAFALTGDGNQVGTWQTVRGDNINGTGSIAVGAATGPLDVHENATLRMDGGAYGVSVWEQGSLIVGPAARFGFIAVYDGTLDLSEVPIGSPVVSGGLGIGAYDQGVTVVAPFGATNLDQLLSLSNLLVHQDGLPVIEDGEQIGTLNRDGSFNITATRTVTFAGFDGRPLAVETVPLFGAATAPDVPVPDGYEFTGWDRAFDYVTENMIVTAEFAQLPAPEPTPEPAPPAQTPASASAGSGGAASPAAKSSKFTPARAALAATGDATGAGLALAGVVAAGAAATAIAAARAHARAKKS